MIWDAFLHSLNCVIILLILGGTGYVTAARGWYDQNSSALMAKLVTFLSLPAYLFSVVMQTLTHDQLLMLLGAMATPFLSIWTCFFVSRLFVKLFRVDTVHAGVFSGAFVASNNMFIGVPVSLALFGEEAMIPTLLYFFANTTFFWTVGNYLEAVDGMHLMKRKPPKILSLTTLKRVFTPPLCGFLTAFVLTLVDWTPPSPIMDAAKYMGGITTPLALVFVGSMLWRVGIRNIRLSKDMLLVYAGRFVICPLICLGLVYVLPIPPLFMKVYVIQAGLPCITQIAVLAQFHRADVEFATTAVASTTLLSLATLPVWMIVLTALIP
ncbi:MAG: AEC family transporter [Sutterella sp.]